MGRSYQTSEKNSENSTSQRTQGLIEILGFMVIFDENQGVSDLQMIWVNMSSFAQYMSKSSSF